MDSLETKLMWAEPYSEITWYFLYCKELNFQISEVIGIIYEWTKATNISLTLFFQSF